MSFCQNVLFSPTCAFFLKITVRGLHMGLWDFVLSNLTMSQNVKWAQVPMDLFFVLYNARRFYRMSYLYALVCILPKRHTLHKNTTFFYVNWCVFYENHTYKTKKALKLQYYTDINRYTRFDYSDMICRLWTRNRKRVSGSSKKEILMPSLSRKNKTSYLSNLKLSMNNKRKSGFVLSYGEKSTIILLVCS